MNTVDKRLREMAELFVPGREMPVLLTEAADTIDRLRAALVGIVGVDGREELEAMEATMRTITAPAEDKAASIDAIHALLATLPDSTETA